MPMRITRFVQTNPERELRKNYRQGLILSFIFPVLGGMCCLGAVWSSTYSNRILEKCKNKGCLVGGALGTLCSALFYGFIAIAIITKIYLLLILMALGLGLLIFFNTYTYHHLKYPKCYYEEINFIKNQQAKTQKRKNKKMENNESEGLLNPEDFKDF